MSKEQQELVGDVYKSYENKYYKGEAFGYKKLNDSEYSPDLKLSQEEFINKCKSDTVFSEKWGLQIEERELSLEERQSIYEKEYVDGMEVSNNNWLNSKLTTRNVPTKLITITYNDKTIESYE
jgi:hypothetical protein